MPKLERHWTVADRDELPDDGNRYEVIDGELFVTPAPALRHQEAVAQLYRLLAGYLEHDRVGHAFIAPADVVFSPNRGVQPDVFVTPLFNGRRPEHFDDVRRLLLAAEVLSPSSARADHVVKRRLFRDEQVDDYWIVDLDARAIERSTPGDARVDVLAETLEWHPLGASQPLTIDLAAYFARVLDD
ncbi:MAG TPA: Uma2 family endonuclease [Gemmatimonadaceae bacterium]